MHAQGPEPERILNVSVLLQQQGQVMRNSKSWGEIQKALMASLATASPVAVLIRLGRHRKLLGPFFDLCVFRFVCFCFEPALSSSFHGLPSSSAFHHFISQSCLRVISCFLMRFRLILLTSSHSQTLEAFNCASYPF